MINVVVLVFKHVVRDERNKKEYKLRYTEVYVVIGFISVQPQNLIRIHFLTPPSSAS